MLKCRLMVVLLSLLLTKVSYGDLLNIIVPYDADLYFSYISGSSAASTDFGLELSDGNYTTFLSDLNSSQQPPYGYEMYAGLFTAGTELTVFELSFWHDNFHFVISDAENPSSINAFTDVNNSLGMGGTVVEQTGNFTWLLHLDDAAPFLDDDDNDVVVQVRLMPANAASVPEPEMFTMLVAGVAVLLMLYLAGSVRRTEKNCQ